MTLTIVLYCFMNKTMCKKNKVTLNKRKRKVKMGIAY